MCMCKIGSNYRMQMRIRAGNLETIVHHSGLFLSLFLQIILDQVHIKWGTYNVIQDCLHDRDGMPALRQNIKCMYGREIRPPLQPALAL